MRPKRTTEVNLKIKWGQTMFPIMNQAEWLQNEIRCYQIASNHIYFYQIILKFFKWMPYPKMSKFNFVCPILHIYSTCQKAAKWCDWLEGAGRCSFGRATRSQRRSERSTSKAVDCLREGRESPKIGRLRKANVILLFEKCKNLDFRNFLPTSNKIFSVQIGANLWKEMFAKFWSKWRSW